MAAGTDYKEVPQYNPRPTDKGDMAQDANNSDMAIIIARLEKIIEDIDSRLTAAGL